MTTLLLIAALAGCSPNPRPSSTAPSPPPASQPAQGPSPSPRETDAWIVTFPPREAWDPEPGGFADQADIRSVIATEAGFLAVGSSARGAVTWASPDGLAWQRRDNDPDLDLAIMGGVVRESNEFLATGYDRYGRGHIWTSADGQDWMRIPDEQSTAPTTDERSRGWASIVLSTPVAGPDGYLASGYAAAVSGEGPAAAVLGRSSDGRSWTRVALPFESGDYGGDSRRDPVAGFGSQRWLLANDQSLWSSTDLRTWHAAEAPPTGVTAFAAWGTRTYAVGSGTTGPTILRSTDGRSWTAVTGLPEVPAGINAPKLIAIAVDEGHIAALGEGDVDGFPSGVFVWHSTDGESWQELPSSPTFSAVDVQPRAIAIRGETVVLAGNSIRPTGDPTSSETRPTFWTMDLSEPAPHVGPSGPDDPPPPSPAQLVARPLAPVPTALRDAAAAALVDGRVLFAGGNADSEESAETAVVYDPRSDSWTPTAPMPDDRSGAAAAVGPDGRVYVFGGTSGDRGTEAAVYDATKGSWRTIKSMPAPRSPGEFAAALGSDGVIYLFGGDTTGTRIDAYDPARNRWSQAGSPPASIGEAAAATLSSGAIVVVTGARAWRFDPPDRWTPLAATLHPRTRGLAAAGPGGTLWLVQPDVLGSLCDQDHVWTTVQRYDPAADLWTEVGALPEPRYAAAITADDTGRLYVMGGTRTTIDSECGWSVDPVDGKSFVLEPAP